MTVPAGRRSNERDWDGTTTAYENFATYVRRLLSVGSTEAFAAANIPTTGRVGRLRLPTVSEVLVGIDRAIRQLEFRDAENGYVAAHHTGARLRFGLCFDRLTPSEAASVISVSWWEGTSFQHGMAVAPPQALNPALGDLKVFQSFRGPPYLVIAAVEPDGVVRRMLLHQVFLSADHLVFVESDFELRYAAWLIQGGRFGIVATVIPVDEEWFSNHRGDKLDLNLEQCAKQRRCQLTLSQ